MKNKSQAKPTGIYLLIFLIPAAAIFWRAIYRSYYYPGWDLVGAANGYFLLKNHALLDAVQNSFWMSRNFHYWSPTSSMLFSLVPGAMTTFHPWEFWAHLLVFIFFFLSFWASGVALQMRGREWAWLGLALGCSPALLSFAICGYPYMSGCLPHAIALLIIFHPRFSKHWWLVLLIGLINVELTWHVYQLGKTVFLLYFLAAAFLSKTGHKNRLIYLLLGLLSLVLIFSGQKGSNLDLFMNLKTYNFSALWTRFTEILAAVFYQPGMDLPIVPGLGLLSIFFLKGRWRILAVMLLAQWGIFLLLGFREIYEMRSRRFLMVDFYSIVVLLAAIRPYSSQYASKLRVRCGAYLLALILMAGSAWQFADLVAFTRTPVQEKQESLPFTATEADYQVHPEYIDAAGQMAQMVLEGNKIILLYNYNTYQENTTDPVALPERLYLRLGHEIFADNIIIFSENFERYSRVPILPLADLDRTLKQIRGQLSGISSMVGTGEYWVIEHPDPDKLNKNFVAESKLIKQTLENYFFLQKTDNEMGPFIGFRISPRIPRRPAGLQQGQ